MTKKKIDLKFLCDKCGKEMPVDDSKSNENWKVFKSACPCGGKAKIIEINK